MTCSLIFLSIDLTFKSFGCEKSENEAFEARSLPSKIKFEAKKQSFSASPKSVRGFLQKHVRWSSKTKLLRETSFENLALKVKNEILLRDILQNLALKLKNEAFLQDFLQKARFGNSKTKHFCETSSKNQALKFKNEAFLRNVLQKRHVDQTFGFRITIRFSDFCADASKVLRMLSRGIRTPATATLNDRC